MTKTPLASRKTLAAGLWLLLLVIPASVLAAPPDLTAPGVIATIDRSSTYNLGPTGLRGWIYVNRANVGDVGLMTDESRQILVTTASAPANAALQVDDLILGAIASSSGSVPYFSSDCRKAFGAAIGEAENTGAGTLRVKRWRAGVTTDVNIPMTIVGDYSPTAPYNCPKTSQILANARTQMVGELLANPNYLANDYAGAIHGLALLASVAPGDPNYATVQTRLQTYARARAGAGPVNNGLPIWDWSYTLLFLAEYYLLTGDAQVVSGINSHTLNLAQSQSIYGTYGHGPSVIRPDGTGRRVSTGYGPVNSVGVIANIALVLGKKALQAASQSIDPEIDSAIERGSNFFAFYVNKGSIPYGEHEPVATSHASNGKDPAAAVFFGLQPNRATEAEYFTRISIATWIGRESGHTGQGFSYLWNALGANIGGSHAASEHLAQVLWHLDLSRRTDGSFSYDGQEQYGGGTTSNGTYLGKSDHYGMNPTAIYLLTYGLPLQRLYITGKKDPGAPDYTLDTTKVAHAVAAGSFRLERTTKTISQLFASLGDYDPVVRHFTAVELAARSLSGTDLTNLRNLLASPDSNIRQSACQALGLRQDTTALPTIVGLLGDPDLWVRSKAATAIRSYTAATASTYRDTMINAFIANATDPAVIDWADPIQMSNGRLSLALFGNAVPDGSPGNNIATYTINAPKQSHLFPALRAGLRQPDSYPRNGVARFARQRLPLADVQSLYPEIVEVAAYDTPADRMWSGDCRAEAIRLMGELKIIEGIPLALSMLDVPENFGWGSGTYLIQALNALASYGDAARHTLPTLKGYLSQWSPGSSEYNTLVTTINTIENAITAPAQNPGLCVANSQIVATTGAKAVTLTGASPRGAFSFLNVTQPAHGSLTGTAPNLTYTPNAGYTGPDKFTFQTTDVLTTSATATVAIIVGPAGNGLIGEYFNNADFTSPVLTRTDSQINFDWGTGSPHASIGADTFSVRWSGVFLVPESGNYTFSALTSDGVRVYVNGTLVIDNFVDQNTRWTDGNPNYLSAGQIADLYVEYYENTGSAVAKLKWTGPSFAGANGSIIPQAYLFDGSGLSNRPAYAFPQNLGTNQNTALPVTLNGSGGTLSYNVLIPPANGTLTGTAPNLTYTPNLGFSGTDSFTFLVNNGSTNSLPATVSISVQAGALTQFNWATATTGNWSEAARWTPGVPAAAGQSNYALNFTISGTYTATHNLNNNFQLNQLNASSTVTIDGTQSMSFVANGGALPQFNQNSTNQVTVNTPGNLAAVTNFGGNNSGNVTLTQQITGSGGILKTNPGRLRLHGFNTNNFTGGTVVNNGTLHLGAIIGGTSFLASNPIGSGTVTLNGATIQFERVTASNPLVVNGGTLFSDNGWGATWSGPVTLNQTLEARCNWPLTLSGSISGSAGISKTGSNELRLTVANSYTGTTGVTDGTVVCSNASALGTGPLIITAPGKVTLNYTGTRVIESLTLDGTPMPPGTYGSSTSTATNKNNTCFSGNGTLTVPQPTTTTLALTNGSSPADPGTSLTFTATVSGTSPTGNVQFRSGTTVLGTSALNGSFQATFTTHQLAIGPHDITARYVGNSTNAPNTSSALVVVINNKPVAAPADLTATPAFTQINLGWTASTGASGYYVKRSTADGGPYTVVALVSGATWQDTTVQGGVTYHYVISAINAAGEGADSNQASAFIGSPSFTITTLESSLVGPEVYGTQVTFTATVTSGSGTPGGTVTFRSGSNIIGTANLGSGSASLVIGTLGVANHSITASYEGEGPHDPSISVALDFEVTPKPLSITGITASDKTYDGNANAILTGETLSGGVIGGETVTIVPGSGTFASPNAGTWAVSATGYSLGGADAGNYGLSAQPAVPNASITPRPVQLTGNRTYDGTSSAAGLMISNQVSGDDLTLDGTATLASKDVGTQGVVVDFATPARVQHATGSTGSNAAATMSVSMGAAPATGNTMIAVIATRGTTANIVSSIVQNGVPNGTWVRAAQSNNTSMTTEIWYATNMPTGAGTAVTINQASSRSAAVVMEYSGILAASPLDQIAPGNSVGTGTAAVTGTITATTQASGLWIGGIGFAHQTNTLGAILNNFTTVDDATSTHNNVSNNARVYALERIVSSTGSASSGGTISEPTQWAGTIATFKAASTSNFNLTGTAAGNYTLTGLSGSVEITPKALTLTATPAVTSKTYDGLTTATLTDATLRAAQTQGTGSTGDGTPYTGDAVAVVLSGLFDTKDAGSDKAVTSTSSLSGAQKDNYTLTQPIGVTGTITPAELTITADDQTKTYGQTLAFGSGATQFTSIGLLDDETIESVTLTCAGGDAAAAVESYPITPSAATGISFNSTNYAIGYVAGTLTVDQATSTITTPPTASDITDGQTLANSILSGGAGSVPGSFAFTAPATKPPVGTATHSVTFTPADTVNYQTATTSVSVTVTAALTTFETWAADPAQGLTAGVNDDPLDDPDHDGFSNLMEFVLGGAPMVSSQMIQPKLMQAAGNWVFSYQRSVASRPPATTQIVEYGDNLSGWTQVIIPLESEANTTIIPQGQTDRVEVTLPTPGTKCYARLKVTQ